MPNIQRLELQVRAHGGQTTEGGGSGRTTQRLYGMGCHAVLCHAMQW